MTKNISTPLQKGTRQGNGLKPSRRYKRVETTSYRRQIYEKETMKGKTINKPRINEKIMVS